MNRKERTAKAPLGIIFTLFGLLCLITAFVINMNAGENYETKLDMLGGTLGPIEVKQDNSVYMIDVTQRMQSGNWSYVSGELLDEKKQYLFSFGKEFWAESGRDSEGPWYEEDTNYDIKITIPKAGIYFVQFKAETSKGGFTPIQIKMYRKYGSYIPFFIAGLASFVVGVVINEVRKRI